MVYKFQFCVAFKKNIYSMLILSTSSLNRNGFRVITGGIDFSNFEKNPLLLYDHREYSMFPIGKMEHLHVEDDKLIGEPVFDEEDPNGKLLKSKYDKGVLNAASIGIRVLKTSSEETDLIKGQSRPTITGCELLEVSIVPIPANANAVRLHLEPDETFSQQLPIIKKHKMDLTKIALALNLGENADEHAILSAIQKNKSNYSYLFTKRRNRLIAEAVELGILSSEKKDDFAFKSDEQLEFFEDIIIQMRSQRKQMIEEGETISDKLDREGEETDERLKWSFDDWSKNDSKGLLTMKLKEGEKYAKLAKDKLAGVGS